ncbi:MAG: acyl-CoA thioesterase [Treponema sp.]|jgi:acyl-CoA thioester hydrolase|nr:acyl-CoA thioesterase [Treponema sp.]
MLGKRKEKILYSVEKDFVVEFFDVDSMQVAWHGNYVKYMEIGRCALLDKLGYGYKQMIAENYAFPVIEMNIKYIKSLFFGEKAKIRSNLIEFENRIRIQYEIFNEKGELATIAETKQMAFNMKTKNSEFVCPQSLIEKVEKCIK